MTPFAQRTLLTLLIFLVLGMIAAQWWRTRVPPTSSANPVPDAVAVDTLATSPIVLNANTSGIMPATPAFTNPAATDGGETVVVAPDCGTCS